MRWRRCAQRVSCAQRVTISWKRRDILGSWDHNPSQRNMGASGQWRCCIASCTWRACSARLTIACKVTMWEEEVSMCNQPCSGIREPSRIPQFHSTDSTIHSPHSKCSPQTSVCLRRERAICPIHNGDPQSNYTMALYVQSISSICGVSRPATCIASFGIRPGRHTRTRVAPP